MKKISVLGVLGSIGTIISGVAFVIVAGDSWLDSYFMYYIISFAIPLIGIVSLITFLKKKNNTISTVIFCVLILTLTAICYFGLSSHPLINLDFAVMTFDFKAIQMWSIPLVASAVLIAVSIVEKTTIS